MRLPCGTLESHLSALLDDALPGSARERLSAHSLTCRHCTRALADLRLARDLVRRQARVGAPAGDLAQRLVAIGATGAGAEGAGDPLAGLRRRRPVMAGPAPRVGALLVLVTLALVTGVGWVAAPQPGTEVADPGRARVDYAGSAAAAVLGSVATAAALSAPSGSLALRRDAAGATEIPSLPVVPGRPLTAGEVAVLVQRSDQSTTEVHRGHWQVQALTGAGLLEAAVVVAGRPGQGTELRVRDGAGGEVSASFVAAGDRWDPHAVAEFAGQVVGHRGQVVVGRAAVVLQADGVGEVVRRWWLDETTGVLLRTETRVAGVLVEAAGYTDLDLAASAPEFLSHLEPSLTRLAAEPMSTSAALSLDQHGWFCRQQVAGLDLVAARGDQQDQPDRLHLTYADAAQQVVVLQQPGSLPEHLPGFVHDPVADVWVRSGWPTVITWQSGATVFSVVGVAPSPVLSEVVDSLPHQARAGGTLLDRVRSGWERVGGLVFG